MLKLKDLPVETKNVKVQVSSRGPYAQFLEEQGWKYRPRPSKDKGLVVEATVAAKQHTGRKTVTGRNPT